MQQFRRNTAAAGGSKLAGSVHGSPYLPDVEPELRRHLRRRNLPGERDPFQEVLPEYQPLILVRFWKFQRKQDRSLSGDSALPALLRRDKDMRSELSAAV